MGDEAAPDVTRVLSEQVRRYREAQGLSQQEVADRTAELGHPMNRVTLAKIEAGGTRARSATLVDVLVLAVALDVPPPLLFLPLGQTEAVEIGGVQIHPHLALEWLAGDEAFTVDGMAHNSQAWHRNAQPIWLFRRLRELQDDARRAWGTDDADRRLERLADHLGYMRSAGLVVPGMPDEWRERCPALEG